MKSKQMKIICCTAIILLILGGVFGRLNQYHEQQIRRAAIEKLAEKTIEDAACLLDSISKFLASQNETSEPRNTALTAVNFFHKLLDGSQAPQNAVQYIKLISSTTSPESMFNLWASICYYVGGFLLAAGLGIMIIIYHQSAVNDLDVGGVEAAKKSTILILRQQAIALQRRAGLILLLILASCIGGYWVVSSEMNSFFDEQRDFYQNLYSDYEFNQSNLMDLLQESMDDQNESNKRLMNQLDEFIYELNDWHKNYIDKLDECYDIDSDDIKFAIEGLDSTISDNADELIDLYLDEDFTAGRGDKQLYDDIKKYVASTTANVKTFAGEEYAKQNKSYLLEIGKMTRETSNRLDFLKKQISKLETSDFGNNRMNDLRYVTGENSLSSSMKNGAEAMDNLYRTSLPNFVLYLRIAIMTIILAFVYFLLREYRNFSRKSAEVEMKIAILASADGKFSIPSAFIKFMMRDDAAPDGRKLLKLVKKQAGVLKKQHDAKQ